MRRKESRRSRRNRAAESVRAKNLAGIFLTVGVGIVVVLIAGAFFAFRPPERDEATGCPIDRPPASLTVVLFDISDPLSPRQDADVRRRLDELRAAIPTDGRIELYALVDKPDALLTPVFVACNPGNPDTVSEWTGSRKIEAELWRTGFAHPLAEAMHREMQAAPSKLSPIMEAIQSVSVTSLLRAEYRSIPRRLVIVSDLIQNVPALNQYKGIVPFARLAETAYYRNVRSDLRGVDVEVLYLWRDAGKSVQGRAHADFWMEFFMDQGARPIIKTVSGGQ